MSPTRRPRTATARVVIALVWVLAVPLAACTGDDGPGTATTVDPASPASSTGDNPLQFTAYVDPGAPITVAIGERFALMLGAEPSQGRHWAVAEEADRGVVLPLGSQFLPGDRAAVASTTTTSPPPETLPDPDPDVAAPEDEAGPGSPEGGPPGPETTTTTVPTEAVQVLSYVGQAAGTTTVVLRYVTVDGSPVEERTSTFTIQVVDPTAPPPPPPEGSPDDPDPGPPTS